MSNIKKEILPRHGETGKISQSLKEKIEDPSVEEIKHLKDPEKAAAIVDSFNKISQEYDEIMTESIKVPPIPKETIPTFTPLQIKKYLATF